MAKMVNIILLKSAPINQIACSMKFLLKDETVQKNMKNREKFSSEKDMEACQTY